MKKVKVMNVTKDNKKKGGTWEDLKELVRQLFVVNSKRKELDKVEKELKDKTNAIADKLVKKDSKGNRVYRIEDTAGNPIIFVREARTSVKLKDEEAEKLFKKKKVLDQVRVVKTISEWDMEAIQYLYAQGIITEDELESITEKTVTYATVFKKDEEEEEEEMPEIKTERRAKRS
jgi:hypothetical protein